MDRFEKIFGGKNILIVDDSLSNLHFKSYSSFNFINPFGKNINEILNEISKEKNEHIPVIGSSLKFNNDNKRTDYQGIKLLLEACSLYNPEQTFFILTFEKLDELRKKDFGYIFKATNINLISYTDILKR